MWPSEEHLHGGDRECPPGTSSSERAYTHSVPVGGPRQQELMTVVPAEQFGKKSFEWHLKAPQYSKPVFTDALSTGP